MVLHGDSAKLAAGARVGRMRHGHGVWRLRRRAWSGNQWQCHVSMPSDQDALIAEFHTDARPAGDEPLLRSTATSRHVHLQAQTRTVLLGERNPFRIGFSFPRLRIPSQLHPDTCDFRLRNPVFADVLVQRLRFGRPGKLPIPDWPGNIRGLRLDAGDLCDVPVRASRLTTSKAADHRIRGLSSHNDRVKLP